MTLSFIPEIELPNSNIHRFTDSSGFQDVMAKMFLTWSKGQAVGMDNRKPAADPTIRQKKVTTAKKQNTFQSPSRKNKTVQSDTESGKTKKTKTKTKPSLKQSPSRKSKTAAIQKINQKSDSDSKDEIEEEDNRDAAILLKLASTPKKLKKKTQKHTPTEPESDALPPVLSDTETGKPKKNKNYKETESQTVPKPEKQNGSNSED